jgi:hypothetical protein
MQYALITCQAVVVIFLVLHDWVSLGKLNNLAGIRAADSRKRRALTTALSALPFAAVLVVSVMFAQVVYPIWLLWWLWGTYLACACGILRAWWIPYLGVADLDRAKRYGIRFAGTHSFLPERNGIRPDSLHVAFHALVLVILGILASLTLRADCI